MATALLSDLRGLALAAAAGTEGQYLGYDIKEEGLLFHLLWHGKDVTSIYSTTSFQDKKNHSTSYIYRGGIVFFF